jgi:DsbC/DsbD-like thiol-disulfide interchange protein
MRFFMGMRPPFRLLASAGAALCMTLILANGPACAQDASRWDEDHNSAVRLIAGSPHGQDAAAPRRAGIEIRLARGWKTYWRYPGDSGVPPKFDFSGSDNVKDVTVLWPAPERFTDDGGQSIGYKGAVIFPLRLTPLDARKPITLRLNLDYAICEKLCVPAQAKTDLVLSNAASSHEAALAAAEGRVPKSAMLNEGRGLVIRSLQRETGARPRIVVNVAAPDGAGVDLFVEGPTPEWALPLPAPLPPRGDGVRQFAFELDGLPPGAKGDNAVLTLTAVAGKDAIEVSARLD